MRGPNSARVRIDRPRDFIPPRTHMFLRVELDGESWLTDVGLGAPSLTQALRLDTVHFPKGTRFGPAGSPWPS